MKKNAWACFLLVLAGIVIGGFIGNLFPDSWLSYGQSFGLTTPLIFDIGIMCITFALTIKITIAGIIGVAIALLVYRFL